MRQLLNFLTVLALLAFGVRAAAQQPPVPAVPLPATPATQAVPAVPVPAAPAVPTTPPVVCPAHPLDGRTIVFVANGAGGSASCAESLRQASAEMHAGLAVLTVPWARQGTLKGDLLDTPAQLRAAGRLAERFQCLRSECPHSRFVFVGYSTGARVVLAAAEQLPPGSLDRIVLMAATVSTYYDLQRALCASCGGIDNFYNRDDTLLEMAQSSWGTSDGGKRPMAGLAGFRYPPGMICPDYCNLRQYAWSSKYGGQGHHTYWVRGLFMHRTLVPLLQTAACPQATVVPAPPHGPAIPPAPPRNTPTRAHAKRAAVDAG